MGPLPWKFAWIIGASSGIGKELALLLASNGVQTTITARSLDALKAICDTSSKLSSEPADITNIHDLKQIVSRASEKHEDFDLVVINAAMWDPMGAEDFSAARSSLSMHTNYVGACNAIEAVLPLFRSRNSGHLVIVASVAGYRGLPQSLAYAPTKAALINLAEALKLELAGTKITITVVNPGFVDTPMTARNTFKMPFIISAQAAARQILNGLERGKFEIAFPWQLVWGLKFLRILPYRLYFLIAGRIAGR